MKWYLSNLCRGAQAYQIATPNIEIWWAKSCVIVTLTCLMFVAEFRFER